MRRIIALALMTVILSFGELALAADDEGTVEKDGVIYKKKTSYDFEDDVVEGELVRPEGEYIDTKRKSKHSSLIRIREHFIPEMLRTVNDI
ncbi:MAG TPA: adventurous gliding motility protein CglF [Myxococcota bacterium]|jgi:hypothetical protein|nr:adventurous gliding motility protein CglF [Myxococcota bacterium]